MIRKWMVAGAGLLLMMLLCGPLEPAAWAAPQSGSQEKPAYTMAEYNAYQTCAKEANAQQRIKLCEDFVSKYPKSTLLPYIYRTFYLTYYELKNYPKIIEYADKLLALGGNLELFARLEALTARAQAYFLGAALPELNKPEEMSKARSAAQDGLRVLEQWKKPDAMTEEQYAQQKRSLTILFNTIGGMTSMGLKDYKSAVDYYKAVLATDPNDAASTYRLGVAYLQGTPPQYMDGFWAVARAIALKVPNEASVRTYLRNQLLRYQQTGCDKLLDQQMQELLTLAAGSAARPENYSIPGKDDLDKARQDMSTFIADLKGGGDKAKLRWLATCGLEFPEVAGKVIEVVSTDDAVTLKVFTGATPEETEAGTVANMEVKVEGQPEAKRIEKDQGLRFSGMLAGYDPDPFMLHWEKAKVNAEDIPEEKAQPGKRPTKRPPKKPPSS